MNIGSLVRQLRHRRWLAAACGVLTAAATCATSFASTDWSAAELAEMKSGAPVVRVTEAAGPADGEVRGAVEIAAPPAAVWAVLHDCAGAPAFMENLKSCTVLAEAADGSWDVREHVIQWSSFLPQVRSEFRSDYVKDQSIRFMRTGGDLSYLEGEWRLEPIAGGKATRVNYEARVGFSSFVPGALVRNALIADIPHFLTVLRQEVLRRTPEVAVP